jgi:hypothetical protein
MLAVILWGLGWCLCSPVWVFCLLLRVAGQRAAKGLGARLLHTEAYEDLHCSVYSCCAAKRRAWQFIPQGVFLGLDLLLTEPVRKCWTEALNVIIIVSGLLTTSSYQAMYSGFGNSDSGGDANGTFSSAQQENNVVTIQAAFRMANTVSFLASLVTIVVSALIVLALQKFATVASAEARVLTKWSQALMYLGYRLSVYSFFTSLAAALLAVGLAAYGMFENIYSNWADSVVVWAFLTVSLILVFVGMLVTTIKTDKARQGGLSTISAEPAAVAAAMPAASHAWHHVRPTKSEIGPYYPPATQTFGRELAEQLPGPSNRSSWTPSIAESDSDPGLGSGAGSGGSQKAAPSLRGLAGAPLAGDLHGFRERDLQRAQAAQTLFGGHGSRGVIFSLTPSSSHESASSYPSSQTGPASDERELEASFGDYERTQRPHMQYLSARLQSAPRTPGTSFADSAMERGSQKATRKEAAVGSPEHKQLQLLQQILEVQQESLGVLRQLLDVQNTGFPDPSSSLGSQQLAAPESLRALEVPSRLPLRSWDVAPPRKEVAHTRSASTVHEAKSPTRSRSLVHKDQSPTRSPAHKEKSHNRSHSR